MSSKTSSVMMMMMMMMMMMISLTISNRMSGEVDVEPLVGLIDLDLYLHLDVDDLGVRALSYEELRLPRRW